MLLTIPHTRHLQRVGISPGIVPCEAFEVMDTRGYDNRYADARDTIYSLMADEVLIDCPQCGGCASHKPVAPEPDRRDWFAPRRLVCPHCALTRDWQKKEIYRSWRQTPARDDYFNEILWIRGSLGAHQIRAYNWQHLELIEKYVAAKHRQHVRDPGLGWANKSFVNRLPKWITLAKNRDDVLGAIAGIKRDRGVST